MYERPSFFSTDNEFELAEAVRLMRKRAAPTLLEKEQDAGLDEAPSNPGRQGPKHKQDEEGLMSLAHHLTNLKGEFGHGDIAEALYLKDDEVDRTLRLMVEHGIVFEVTKGKFRSVL